MKLPALTEIALETVGAIQRDLPPELRLLASNVPVHYQSGPSAEIIAEGFEPDILGLFTGDPLGVAAEETSPLPPQIILYLENIWDLAEGDLAVFREETHLTYLHELGHYFGWDEDDVARHGLE